MVIEVSFKGPLKKVFGFKEFFIEGGSKKKVLKRLSENLGVQIVDISGKIFIKAKINEKDVKFRISIFYNGENIELSNVEEFKEGKIEIITPVGGG